MAKRDVKKVVWKNHSFYWRTDLTNKRMEEINDWIESLTKQQRSMLSDLISDVRQDTRFDTTAEYEDRS